MNNVAAETVSVVVERDLSFPPEKVWRTLTQPHLMEEWLTKNDFQPVVGHNFSLRMDPHPGWNGVIDCKVLVIEQNKTLSYTWTTLGLETAVTFTLTPTPTGTLLRMEQTGFPSDRPQNYQGAKYGWQKFFGNLEQVLGRMN
jgi:uncharacterized protein YndB with AHSA1/START domain